MENWLSRTELLIGEAALEKLARSHVAVFGVGGVGSYAVEALVRSGVGELTLIDHDVVAASNINRQILALHSTVGCEKVVVMRERVMDINPKAQINVFTERFLPAEHDWDFDYIIDAVDTVSCKLSIINEAKQRGIPLICALGAGNRLDPMKFRVGDIYETQGCPLAKVMRGLCRKNGIEKLKVVYSTEPPLVKQEVIGSVAFVPSVAGLLMAGEVIKELL